ncbi:MAG: hypothetical protein HDR36_02035 [Treponema sp.]|nr:hypothetical protein [Treponema sp.]
MSEKISRLSSDTALNFPAGINTFVSHVNVSAPFHAVCLDSTSLSGIFSQATNTPPHIKKIRKTKDSMRVKENRCFMLASKKNITIIIAHYSRKSNKRKKIKKPIKPIDKIGFIWHSFIVGHSA